MSYTTDQMTKQVQGYEAALTAGDSRYDEREPMETWTLTLWGGLEVEIRCGVTAAKTIQAASQAQGDDALFTIRGGRKIQ